VTKINRDTEWGSVAGSKLQAGNHPFKSAKSEA